MNLHEQLIDELLNGNVSRSPREEAARLEILKLREMVSPKNAKYPLETETPKASEAKNKK